MTGENTGRYSILVIEDEPILGRVCKRILEANGYSVTLAVNGLAAKHEVEKSRFDCCLSDIKTPVMNGMEFYKILKLSCPALAEHTVFMTGDAMNKDVEIFLEENNAPYILKPFTDAQLTRAVSEHLI